jgi:2-alkyl-3-oxoalkanoate reductase
MLAAGRRVKVRRFIAQSFCGWPYAREGGPVKTEDDPLDPAPPANFTKTLAAIRYLEDAVRSATDLEAIALRYGFFYGPRTSIARDGSVIELVRKCKVPIVGDGGGIWSFIHIEDAARATLAAVSRGAPGSTMSSMTSQRLSPAGYHSSRMPSTRSRRAGYRSGLPGFSSARVACR